ncbi:MAG: hypothetical protein ABI867_11050 [Kofleriaceae bacterium]
MKTTPIYSFLPWSRMGIANNIEQADNDASVVVRAQIPIDIEVDVDPVAKDVAGKQVVHKDIELYGPGDVIGVDPAAIVRLEPRPNTSSFESNMLCYAEFHDPDFPWRYTPAKVDGARLRPWLAVVALAADEFEEVHMPGRPLSSFKLATGKQAADLFPPVDQMWAWAHVHANESLKGSSLQAAIDHDPDLVTSRVLCPRHLTANTRYTAFVVPVFESGRLSGLGTKLPDGLVATTSAWATGQAEFPYYYRWEFRTGFGDFEYLVRLLKPKPADPRVGIRDLDVLHPGAPLPAIAKPALAGAVKLGGALRVPALTTDQIAARAAQDAWADPQPSTFQTAIATEINSASAYEAHGATPADPDPIVTLPLYGRWHARQPTVDAPYTNWVDQLNVDPRFRVAAAFGTSIVQQNQETYMDAAWQQVGDVIEANKKIVYAQLARAASSALHTKHVKRLEEGRAVMITAPMHRRVVLDGLNVRTKINRSRLPVAATATSFRAMVRPRGRLVRRAGLAGVARSAAMIPKLDAGTLVAAGPWKPAGGLSFNTLAKTAASPPPAAPPISPEAKAQLLKLFSPSSDTSIAVHAMPAGPYRNAMLSVSSAFDHMTPMTPSVPVGSQTLAQRVTAAIDPHTTVPARYRASVAIPARIAGLQLVSFAPAMYYPEIDQPMYKPLADKSSELFLPNINLLGENTVTLLETNQRFIESYMVGLNHEMARELLWREYPTDQRGSYFRQFWDVSGVYPGDPPPTDLREKLRDIPPISTWSKVSALGKHDQRVSPDAPPLLVLVIRGELLRRYPNTILFALKATWAKDAHGKFDRTLERTLDNLDAAEQEHPPHEKVRTPMFEARVGDIYFIGFYLDAKTARGATDAEEPTKDNAGWFFCLQQRPGEPQFGIDVPPAADVAEPVPFNGWNDLDWAKVGTPEGGVIKIDKTITPLAPTKPDQQAHWSAATNAGELAYILYQELVLVAVHAHRMLT